MPIHHSDTEQRPRAGVTYRCHICRLELVIDSGQDKLVLAPLATGQLDHAGTTSSRTIYVDTDAPAPPKEPKKKR
jgi:hypothetical protein